MDRLFLDANVLFSIAYGSPGIGQLWGKQRQGHCRLMASRYVIEEVKRNLDQPEQHRRLEERLKQVALVPEPPVDIKCQIELAEKDRPVFLAALAARATHLITGDVRHFGDYFGKKIQGVEMLKPADYLKSLSTAANP